VTFPTQASKPTAGPPPAPVFPTPTTPLGMKDPSVKFWTALLNAQQAAQKLAKKHPGPPNKRAPKIEVTDPITGQRSMAHPPMWTFVSAEDFIEEARRVLHPEGLVLVPTGIMGELDAQFGRRNRIALWFLLVHAPSGEGAFLPMEFPYQTNDRSTHVQAAANSYTQGLAYFLRGLLMIPRVSPRDEDYHEVLNSDAPPPRQQPQQGFQQPAPAQQQIFQQPPAQNFQPRPVTPLYQGPQGTMIGHYAGPPPGPQGTTGGPANFAPQPTTGQPPMQRPSQTAQRPQPQQPQQFPGQQPLPRQGGGAQPTFRQGAPVQSNGNGSFPGGAPHAHGQVPQGNGFGGGGGPGGGAQRMVGAPGATAVAPLPPLMNSTLVQGMVQQTGAVPASPAQDQAQAQQTFQVGPPPPQAIKPEDLTEMPSAVPPPKEQKIEGVREDEPQTSDDWFEALLEKGWDPIVATEVANHPPNLVINDAVRNEISSRAMSKFATDEILKAWKDTGFVPDPKAGANRPKPTGLQLLRFCNNLNFNDPSPKPEGEKPAAQTTSS